MDFRQIKGYEELYYVSNTGLIKRSGKILKKIIDTNKYISATLCKNGKARRFRVHRLVAEAFIPNPENKKTVNHKDGDVQNNIVENLEWATYRENSLHSFYKLGNKNPRPCIGKFGKEHNRSKAFTTRHIDGTIKT